MEEIYYTPIGDMEETYYTPIGYMAVTSYTQIGDMEVGRPNYAPNWRHGCN